MTSCSENNKSPSRSPTPRRSSGATNVRDGGDDDDGGGGAGDNMYAAELYRIKRRKCAAPFRRTIATAKKKYVVGPNDNHRGKESESLTFENFIMRVTLD